MEKTKGIASPLVRIPPQDVEAEKALLGSIMLKPEIMPEVAEIVSAEAFYAEKHKIIYRAMLELSSKNEPIDLLALASRLKEKKQLEQIGGASYLTELLSLVPSASNANHYAQIVQKKSVMRSLISAADHISNLGYQEDENLDSILDLAGKRILEVATRAKRKFVSIKESLTEAWERLERLHHASNQLRGVPTGFPELDNKLAGLQKSDLILLAARPSIGKTTLALDIARQTALKHGTTVGIFSLEMSSQQLVDRMLASESRIDSWKLRTGKLSTDDEFQLIRDALDKLSKASIFIDDDPAIDVMRMRSVARRLKSEHNLGLIIIDYLQLMTAHRNFDSLVQQVTEISRSLKALARELEIPVLALSQLNRNVETRGGRPRLSDLRDSGSLEQDADVVMFIHREEKTDEPGRSSVAEILIEKHRNGPTGKIELYFDERRVSFSSIEKTQFGEL